MVEKATKLTDNDIIKALECCSSKNINTCDNCPFCKQCDKDEQLSKDALDLINRQKTEIERLQKAIQVQEIMLGNQDYAIKKARAEAITEFAERLKAEAEEYDLVENLQIGFMDKDRNYWCYEANCHTEETDELLDEIDFDLDDLGKTVFLTREEAEAKLKGEQ